VSAWKLKPDNASCACAWGSRGWRWHGCSISTLDTCSYVRSQESGGSSSWDWTVSSAVSICMRRRVSGRTSVGICRAYKCRPLDYAMRGITHQPPRCRAAGLEPSTAIIHHSFTIHHPLIHQYTSRPLLLCPSVLTRSVPPSTSCLSAMHRLPFVPSLPITGLGPISAYLRIYLHPCPHILILLSTHTPQPEHLNTSEHVGPL
jgi:hypothetical protein